MPSADSLSGNPVPVLTDRARRVMDRAREEQRRLGHPALAADHVLLGLMTDRQSIAAFVLRELNVDDRALAEETRSQLALGMPDPVIDESALMHGAARWAGELKQVSVGTEHLLLAVVESQAPAAARLAERGANVQRVRATTERVLPMLPRRSGPSTTQ